MEYLCVNDCADPDATDYPSSKRTNGEVNGIKTCVETCSSLPTMIDTASLCVEKSTCSYIANMAWFKVDALTDYQCLAKTTLTGTNLLD